MRLNKGADRSGDERIRKQNQKLGQVRGPNVATRIEGLSKPEEGLESWSGWTLPTGAPAGAPAGGLSDSQTIRLAPGQVAFGLLPLARVSAGQWATAKIHLASTLVYAATLRVLLAREGGEGDAFFKTFVKVDQQSRVVRVTGKFPFDQTGLRLELRNMGARDAEFLAGRPSFRFA